MSSRRQRAARATFGLLLATLAAGAGAAGRECPECGTVEAIRPYELRDGGMPVPARGAREGRTVYRITVRMEDGSFRTLSQPQAPALGSGDRVRVIRSQLFPGRE